MGTNYARGWRRIGIVVSIIWFIVFGLYVWGDSARQNGEFYQSQLGLCYSMEDDDIRMHGQLSPAGQERDQKCRADAQKFFFSQIDKQRENIPILIGVDLATIAVGWALVWFVVFVVRWVRRGFASA
jgi:hypothetical protein